VATDTATIVIFDTDCLKHKLEDDCDWWSAPVNEVPEINNGNILFLDVGADGTYEVETVDELPANAEPVVEANLRNESGRFFIGPGEDTTGEGLEPTAEYGSVFIEVPAGPYNVRACLVDDSRVLLRLTRIDEFIRNTFTGSPTIA